LRCVDGRITEFTPGQLQAIICYFKTVPSMIKTLSYLSIAISFMYLVASLSYSFSDMLDHSKLSDNSEYFFCDTLPLLTALL